MVLDQELDVVPGLSQVVRAVSFVHFVLEQSHVVLDARVHLGGDRDLLSVLLQFQLDFFELFLLLDVQVVILVAGSLADLVCADVGMGPFGFQLVDESDLRPIVRIRQEPR